MLTEKELKKYFDTKKKEFRKKQDKIKDKIEENSQYKEEWSNNAFLLNLTQIELDGLGYGTNYLLRGQVRQLMKYKEVTYEEINLILKEVFGESVRWDNIEFFSHSNSDFGEHIQLTILYKNEKHKLIFYTHSFYFIGCSQKGKYDEDVYYLRKELDETAIYGNPYFLNKRWEQHELDSNCPSNPSSNPNF